MATKKELLEYLERTLPDDKNITITIIPKQEDSYIKKLVEPFPYKIESKKWTEIEITFNGLLNLPAEED